MPILLQNGHEKIYGIDYSERMLAEAENFNKELITAEKIELKFGSADSIPYPNEFFDKICSINTIYFWDDVDKVITELKRVLKSGGVLTAGFRSKERVKDLKFTKYNFNLYSIDEVEKLFIKSGLQILETIVEDEEHYDAVCVTVKKPKLI